MTGTLIRAGAWMAALALTLPASTQAQDAPIDPTPTRVPDRVVLSLTSTPQTSQAFGWRTDASRTEGRVEAEPLAGDGPTSTQAATSDTTVTFRTWDYESRHHRATLTGLEPDTAYRYRVGAGDHWSPWRTFRTARSADDERPWEWLYFGDAQNDIRPQWTPVVDRAFETVPDALLALHAGDLINNADQDAQWTEWFGAMAGHADRIGQITTPGNHEYSGDDLLTQYRAHFPRAATSGPLSSFSVDVGGVRFVSVDANDPVPWLTGQLAWARSQLADNPHRWSVLTFHQPVFSNAEGRDEANVRANWLPVIEDADVDLVLMGHDHTYGRGHLNADRTTTPGVTDGPVFVTANSGPKHYELTGDADNVWTQNGATRVKGFGFTSTFQRIRVERDRLVYRAYVGAKDPRSTVLQQVGAVVDAFTISKPAGGGKRVTQGASGEPVPAEPEVPTPPSAPASAPPATPRAASAPSVQPARGGLRWRRTTVARDGSLRVRLTVPSSGRLELTARGVRRVRRSFAMRTTTTLTLRPTASAQRRLRAGRRVPVTVTATFRPRSGEPVRVTRRLTLRARSRGARAATSRAHA